MKRRNMLHSTNKEAGFTLVELMIATVVFSVIMVGASTAIVQIGRMYYKGVIMSRTQETSRRIMDDITRPIQFTGGDARLSSPEVRDISGIQTGAVCIGKKRFTFGLNVQVNANVVSYSAANHRGPHALYQDELLSDTAVCEPRDLSTRQTGGRELLAEHMRLGQGFAVVRPAVGTLWAVRVVVIYGDDDLLLPNANEPTSCAGVVQGAQWCAISSLSTQVYKRIN